MAEVKASSVVVILLILGVVGFLVLSFGGWIAVGWFNKDTGDELRAAARGYPSAKTPAEAMDLFRKAITNRAYHDAGRYCTKPYKTVLERAHLSCSELTEVIDPIVEYGHNKGYMTDKLAFALHMIDPFPRNFNTSAAPEMKGDTKAVANYQWEALKVKNEDIYKDATWAMMDMRMFQAILRKPFGPKAPIELVKEGEYWKLNIPTTADFEADVSYFIEHVTRYKSNLVAFKGDMLNNRFTSHTFETEIIVQLRAGKK